MSRERTDPGGSKSLIVTERQIRDIVVVSVAGEVDMLTAPQLFPAIEQSVADGPCRLLVVDVTAVTFLGSVGLKVLLDIRQLAADRGLPVRLVAAGNRHVTRPLEITGLERMLASSGSVDEALQEVDRAEDVG